MVFDVIYADPPWAFFNWTSKGIVQKGMKWAKRNGRAPYDVMSIEDIAALPVKDIASKNSILFLWATWPKLEDALKVIKAWGFTYKTVGWVWIKTYPKKGTIQTGLGYWTRSASEFCLIATRGHPKRVDKNVHSIVISPVYGHSSKPIEIRARIDRLVGLDCTKVELFARNERKITDNWTFIGNEVLDTPGMDIREAIELVKHDKYSER